MSPDPKHEYSSWLAQKMRWKELHRQPAPREGAEHPCQPDGDRQQGTGGCQQDGKSPESGDGAQGEVQEVTRKGGPVLPAQGPQVVPCENRLGDEGGQSPGDDVCEPVPTRGDERAAGAVGGEEHRGVHGGRMNEECGMSNEECSAFVQQVCSYLAAPDNAEIQALAEFVSRETKNPRWGAVLVMRRISPDHYKEFAQQLGFEI